MFRSATGSARGVPGCQTGGATPHRGLTTPWWISHAFGTLAMTVATAVAAGLMVIRKHVRAAAYVVLAIAGTMVATSVLKRVVDLPRPVVEGPILQYSSSAMPSGHASNIAAMVTAACVLLTLFADRRTVRRLVLVAGVVVALVVGLDRLMLGVHTPTEVVAGDALGVGIALLTASLFDVHAAPSGAGHVASEV